MGTARGLRVASRRANLGITRHELIICYTSHARRSGVGQPSESGSIPGAGGSSSEAKMGAKSS